MLTASQVEHYREQGYVVIPGVLTADQVAEGRRIMDAFVEQSRLVTASTEVFDLEPGHSRDHPMLRRIKNPAARHPFFADVIRSAPVLDILESVVGPNIRLLGSKLNLKAAGAGSPVEWHQDFAFHPHTNDDVCALGIAFDDADLDNGCLMYVPGSHRGPVLDHHQDGYFVGAVSPTRDGIDLSGAVPAIVKAGGVLVHHGRMLHGSAANRSGRPRRLLLFDIAAVDAWPIGWDPGDLDAYDAQIIRGQPTITPRVEAMQRLRIPRPQPAKHATIFELQEQVKDSPFDRPAT